METCDGKWADQLSAGKYESFSQFMQRECLYNQTVKDSRGVTHPAGSLKLPIANENLSRASMVFQQGPFPAPIPLLQGLNASALNQARAGTLQSHNGPIDTNNYDRSKRAIKNVMSNIGI